MNDLVAQISRSIEHINQGDYAAAEPLLARILAAEPGQPQAGMLLGVVRLNQGRPAEAEVLLRHALGLNPRHAMTLFYLGNARRDQGDLVGAIEAWNAAMETRPHFGEALLAMGNALNELDRNEEAEALLAPASRWPLPQPDLAEIENALGTAKLAQRRADEALAHFEKALALQPGLMPAQKNRAVALEHLRQTERAADAYRNVLARNPLDLESHLMLNELLHRAGRDSELLTSYDEAMRVRPSSAELLAAKADQLLLLEKPGEAEDFYRRALRLKPELVRAHIGLARALAALGNRDRAGEAFRAAQNAFPRDSDVHTAFARHLLGENDAKAALTLSEKGVALNPASQAALAMLGLCYRATGDGREGALNGYDDFIKIFDLEPPAGYGDTQSFHRDLAAHMAEAHRDARHFYSQTLRGGNRSFGEFFRQRHALRDGLKDKIRDALQRYIAAFAPDTKHPFLGRRARDFAFSGSWSSSMADGGYHLNHIHSGWISSVYYVEVPDVLRDDPAQQGWLKFGEPSADLGFQGAVRRMVEPRPGRLVLFPSYLWHGTVAYHSPQARTTIAFDVVPR